MPNRKKYKRTNYKRTSVSDLNDEEKELAKKYDVDGDGFLDEAELAMMQRDKNGDGELSNDEIYQIVAGQLSAKRDVKSLRKVIGGLICFVFILALSNLGTSMASAILAKETKADSESGTMKVVSTGEIMGAQSAGETVDLEPLSVDERRARRALVVAELQADPHGSHSHRRLAKNNASDKGCKKKDASKCSDGKITFDAGKMKQKDVEMIQAKCDGVKTVNIKRKFSGGTLDSHSLCKPGTTIVVKGKKKTARPVNLKPNKNNNRDGRQQEIIFKTDENLTNVICDGTICYFSGTSLLQGVGGPCEMAHGNDDCEQDLICYSADLTSSEGRCFARDDFGKSWYSHQDYHGCRQDCEVGPNCGGLATSTDEMFGTATACCSHMLSWQGCACVQDWQEAPEGKCQL